MISGGRSGRPSVYVKVETTVVNKMGQCEETRAVNGILRNTYKERHESLYESLKYMFSIYSYLFLKSILIYQYSPLLYRNAKSLQQKITWN